MVRLLVLQKGANIEAQNKQGIQVMEELLILWRATFQYAIVRDNPTPSALARLRTLQVMQSYKSK